MSSSNINFTAGTSVSSPAYSMQQDEVFVKLNQLYHIIEQIIDLKPGTYLESNLTNTSSSAFSNSNIYSLEPVFKINRLHHVKCNFNFKINNNLVFDNLSQIYSHVKSCKKFLEEKKFDPEVRKIIEVHKITLEILLNRYESNPVEIQNRLGWIKQDAVCSTSKKLFAKSDERTHNLFLEMLNTTKEIVKNLPPPPEKLQMSFNGHISAYSDIAENKVIEYLVSKGFAPDVNGDYTNVRPECPPEVINRNHEIVKHALDPRNDEFQVFLEQMSENLYSEGRITVEQARVNLCKVLEVKKDKSIEELKEILLSNGVDSNDPKMKLIADMLCFARMDKIDHSEAPSQGDRLDVTIKGLIMGTVVRIDNEINTIKDLWMGYKSVQDVQVQLKNNTNYLSFKRSFLNTLDNYVKQNPKCPFYLTHATTGIAAALLLEDFSLEEKNENGEIVIHNRDAIMNEVKAILLQCDLETIQQIASELFVMGIQFYEMIEMTCYDGGLSVSELSSLYQDTV